MKSRLQAPENSSHQRQPTDGLRINSLFALPPSRLWHLLCSMRCFPLIIGPEFRSRRGSTSESDHRLHRLRHSPNRFGNDFRNLFIICLNLRNLPPAMSASLPLWFDIDSRFESIGGRESGSRTAIQQLRIHRLNTGNPAPGRTSKGGSISNFPSSPTR